MVGPLAGVRVLELTDELGAYCGKLLADLGADVIKVEPPGGGAQRQAPPHLSGEAAGPDTSLAFWVHNTSKRSLVLDLETESGRAAARRLALDADVVLEDFAVGHLAARGLGYGDLSGERPTLVYTSVTGFGQTGPHARHAYSDIVGQAMGGVMTLAGEPEDPPHVIYGNQANVSASIQAAQGTLLALFHALRTGEGQHVDVSAQEALSVSQETAMMTWDFQHTNRARVGALGRFGVRLLGAGVYPAKEGHVLSYVIGPAGGGFPELVEWMDERGFAHDLREEPYAELVAGLTMSFITRTLADPKSAEEALPLLQHVDDEIAAFYATMTATEAYEAGQHRRLLVGIVSTPKDLAKNAQLRAREWYRPVAVDGREVEFPGPPYRLAKTPASVTRPPRLGEHAGAGWAPREDPPRRNGARPKLPLDGLRVADFSWFGAGPIAGQTLATFGAEVVRVESEARLDSLRMVQPFPLEPDGTFRTGYNVSGYFNNFNAGKLSLLLNLNTERGQEIGHRLIEGADVFLSNFTPRVIEKWNLRYEQIAAVNPRIVAAYAPMQGLEGPHRDFLGFGAVLTPITGISELSGYPHRPPIGVGTNYPDYVINPGHTVTAILAALRHRELTGEGQLVELPQIESVVATLGTAVLDYLANGTVQTRTGNRSPVAAPHGAFRCQDDPESVASPDRWIAIACRTDADWAALCEALGHAEAASDPRFATFADRKANEDALEALVGEWTRPLRAEEVMERLQARGVPAGVVQNAQDILERDAHVRARGYYQYLDHPETGRSAYDGPCARLSATPGRHRAAAPLLGEHTHGVATRILGLGDEEIADLIAEGVLA